MPSGSANRILPLLERVLIDALNHECEAVVIIETGSMIRFQSESGASFATLLQQHVSWNEVMDVLTRLKDDATALGHPECVIEDDTERKVTIQLKENEAYFRGKVKAIIARLRF